MRDVVYGRDSHEASSLWGSRDERLGVVDVVTRDLRDCGRASAGRRNRGVQRVVSRRSGDDVVREGRRQRRRLDLEMASKRPDIWVAGRAGGVERWQAHLGWPGRATREALERIEAPWERLDQHSRRRDDRAGEVIST